MRSRPRPQDESSCAKIQMQRAADEQRWRHDAYLVDQLVAHGTSKCIEIELSARGQGAWQVRVADKGRFVLHESAVAEKMIGVAMRIDDVPDRLVGPGTNSCHQSSSLADAAAGIDHRDCILSDDETDIGDRTVVLTCHLRGSAVVNEYAIRNGVDGQLLLLRARSCHRSEHRERSQDPCGMSHIWASAIPCFIVATFASQHRRQVRYGDYSCCALQLTSIAFCSSAASTELGSSRLPIFF